MGIVYCILHELIHNSYRGDSHIYTNQIIFLYSIMTPGPYREGVNPKFTTISSRTVIPDQSELDQVDEEALKRGHEEITVDKDDEILTEVIEGECELNQSNFIYTG